MCVFEPHERVYMKELGFCMGATLARVFQCHVRVYLSPGRVHGHLECPGVYLGPGAATLGNPALHGCRVPI